MKVAALAAAGSLLLAACGGTGSGGSGTGDGAGAQEFIYATSGPVQSWDPQPETRAFAMGWFGLVYDGLLTTDAEGNLQPGLAEEWEVGPDTITLDLREGVEFADGTPFDAAAVQHNIERGQDAPGVTGAVLKQIASVEATDDHEVVLRLAGPAPDLLDQLGRLPGLMTSPGVSDEDLARGVAAGTGPYVIDLDASNPESAWKFTRNDDYWNDDIEAFEKVEYRIMPDPSARMNALLSGQVHAVDIAPTQRDQAEDAGLTVNLAETNVATFEILDSDGTRVEALADERVRRALALAIDREAFATTVFGGLAVPADQLLAEGQPGYLEDFDGFGYDPEEAKRLLADAGAEDLKISIPTDPAFFAKGATAVQGMLAKVGVEVEVVTVANGAEMTSKIAAAEFPATYTYIPDRHPQSIYGKHLLPGAVYNPFEVAKPEVAAAAKAALEAFPDEDAMAAAYDEMFRAVYDQALIIPIVRLQGGIAFDPEKVADVPAWTGVPLTPHVATIKPLGS